MGNPFKGVGSHLNGLVYDFYPVTPSDGTDNVGDENIAIGLYIEAGGDVVFLTKDGTERTVTVPDYFYLTCSVSRVKSTGTSATGIFALVV